MSTDSNKITGNECDSPTTAALKMELELDAFDLDDFIHLDWTSSLDHISSSKINLDAFENIATTNDIPTIANNPELLVQNPIIQDDSTTLISNNEEFIQISKDPKLLNVSIQKLVMQYQQNNSISGSFPPKDSPIKYVTFLYLCLFNILLVISQRKHKRDIINNEQIDRDIINAFGEYDDRDLLKVMRIGSLERIIASSVVATRISSSDVTINPSNKQPSDLENLQESRKKILGSFIKSLKFNDLNGLANFISEVCTDYCFLSTPDLSQLAITKSRIMIYFGLVFEMFPDGVWNIQSQIPLYDTISIIYTFVGRNVSEHSMDTLFRLLDQHTTTLISSSSNTSPETAELMNTNNHQLYYEKLMDHMAEYVHTHKPLPVSRNSLTTPESSDAPINPNETLEDNDNVINVRSHSNVSISNILPTQLPNKAMSFEGIQANVNSKNPNEDKHVRSLVNKVLDSGKVKYHRRMDLVFNDDNKIIRIIIR